MQLNHNEVVENSFSAKIFVTNARAKAMKDSATKYISN
jgi:hypothetical protein